MNKLLPTIVVAIGVAFAPVVSAQAQEMSDQVLNQSAGDTLWTAPAGDPIPLQTMSWAPPPAAAAASFGNTGDGGQAWMSAGSGETGAQRNAEQTRSHNEASYTIKAGGSAPPNLNPTYNGNIAGGGLPPTRLDSLVRDAGGSAEAIYGDEGEWDIPPYFGFTPDHYIINGIPGGLTTGHESGLPSAWGYPQ